jgi:hypothetical protein
MTEQDILNAGYKEYPKTPFDFEGIEKNYQKCFYDDIGRKYFINIHKWRDMHHPHTGELIEGGYNFTTQFEDKNTGAPMNLDLFSGWTIEEAEATIERIWKVQFKYYDKYYYEEDEE